MAIVRLGLRNFTVFREASFAFAPGINVFIGQNATGKSHLLKLLYAVESSMWEQQPSGKQAPVIRFEPLEASLVGVFRIQSDSLEALIRTANEPARASFRIDWANGGFVTVDLSRRKIGTGALHDGPIGPAWASNVHVLRPVFLPAREVLSVFPGFAATIQNRELEFDETYAHLADALNLPKLKGEALKRARPLLTLVEEALGGTETKKEGRFYVKFDEGLVEAHLVAEGLRKVATLARLIRNGRIGPGAILFWDEPEANLNPVLLRSVVNVLLALARGGVQVFLASHDYLLTQTLSLEAEHPGTKTPPMRFFGLARGENGSVEVEQADTIAGIQRNPILQEHARQYDLEAAAFARDAKRGRGGK